MSDLLHYNPCEAILHNFYQTNQLGSAFPKDNSYLKRAFLEMNSFWYAEYDRMRNIRYIIIGEAPLWGEQKKYIYNPSTRNTQFFYRSDLAYITHKEITSKREFLDACREVGMIFIDISPFALNPQYTAIDYRTIALKSYQFLVKQTLDHYFIPKLDLIKKKISNNLSAVYRYKRVQNAFYKILDPVFREQNLIHAGQDITDIARSGGGVDRRKLSMLFK